MKHTKSYIASLLLLSAAFTACDEELDRPPVIVPEATIEANTSILEVKNKYWNDNRNYIDTIGVNSLGEHVIVSGRIISSDETGNIYKNLVIQDESAALTISINENDMFESYHIGQEVVIDLTDMYIGKYNGLQQLGFPEYSTQYGWEATFMEMDFFKQHAQFNGLPQPAEIDTIPVDIAKINAIKSNADSLQKWQSQLVRFDSVQWVEAGKPYSEASASTNRYIKDANGNKMLVRNSSYATFRDKLLPSGTGSVVGILSYYGTEWQVMLRSTDDCIGFDESAPVVPDAPTGPLSELEEDFEGVSSINDLPGWTSVKIAGDKEWYFTDFDNNTYAACTAYKGTDGSGYDAWLITPALNVDEMAQKIMSFESQAAYMGGTFEVYAMSSTDPNTATLTMLTCDIANPPASGYSGFVSSGPVSLEEFSGVIYIGFRYTAETSARSMTFCIDNVVIGKQGGSSNTPSTGDGSENSPFSATDVQNGATGTGVWVEGYIVGWVDGMILAEGANFSVPSTSQTNVLISDNPKATSAAECIPVQLPTSIRGAINLMDNPSNLGKKLAIKGNITKYFGENGVKEGTEYKLDGKAPATAETATYKKATSITSGKEYILVASGKAATAITGNYGYLQVVDASDNNGVIEVAQSCGFVIKETTGGYTITDANGKYMYMKGTYNSFNVDTTLPSEGGVWTIAPQADGTMIITNVAMNKSIQYDAQYTSYGAYPDVRGTFPTLYEKTN
ncbi:MAG: choice-of-anchor J domain-containing protein [Muribaculaceae bacterium]|nr:choice-of-anchor J domain-containing protein [Muribaculaceae bacterium]